MINESISRDDVNRFIKNITRDYEDALSHNSLNGRLLDKSISKKERILLFYLDLWHGKWFPYDNLDEIRNYQILLRTPTYTDSRCLFYRNTISSSEINDEKRIQPLTSTRTSIQTPSATCSRNSRLSRINAIMEKGTILCLSLFGRLKSRRNSLQLQNNQLYSQCTLRRRPLMLAWPRKVGHLFPLPEKSGTMGRAEEAAPFLYLPCRMVSLSSPRNAKATPLGIPAGNKHP